MFKEKYKEAHNKIVPDKELLQKIIATADYELEKKNKKSLKKHTKISFYPYLYAAAAVMVIATSLTAYNALKPEDTKNYASVLQNKEKNLEENKVELAKKVDEKSQKSQKSEKSEKKEKEKKEVKNIKKIDTANKEVKSNQITNEAITEGKNSVSESKEEQKELIFDAIKENQLNEPVDILLNVNNITNDTSPTARLAPLAASGGASKEVNESIYEEISKEEYESYIGFSLEETAVVPQDMLLYPNEDFILEKDSQTGKILNDEKTYYFESSFQRFIMITTTKNTTEIDNFLNNENYKKTVMNDNNNIVVTLNEGIYNAYLKRNDTGIKITAGKIEEKELENTIKSLLE